MWERSCYLVLFSLFKTLKMKRKVTNMEYLNVTQVRRSLIKRMPDMTLNESGIFCGTKSSWFTRLLL
jgi:hypothetical protein